MVSLLSHAQDYTTLRNASKKTVQIYHDATKQIMNNNYQQAILTLEDLTSKEQDFIDGWLLLGELYKEEGNYAMAKMTLERVMVIDSAYSSKCYFFLTQINWQLDQFEDCIGSAHRYLSFSDISRQRKMEVEQMLYNSIFSLESMKHPVPFDPKPLGPAVNSGVPEYLPSLTGDEKTIVFTRRSGTGRNQNEDFYWSEKGDSGWTMAMPLVDINSLYNEGAQTQTPDGNTIYFVVCDKPGGYGSCDIYVTKRTGKTWSHPTNIGAPVCTNSWETQPSISADGNTLYFISTRPGGKGGSDVWIATKDKSGKWSSPVNAGDSINTVYDEKSVFIHHDNKTLYFSSPGHPGMGKDDIFYSRKEEDGGWSEAVNLGYPINTKNDENSLVVALNGRNAYFSSDRYNKNRDMDLYQFELYEGARPEPVIYVSGKVIDRSTELPVEAAIELINLETGTVAGKSKSDAIIGTYLVSVPTGKNYALNVAAPGYLFYSENFILEYHLPADSFLLDVRLQAIQTGNTVILKNIFFDSDSTALKPFSKAELNKLVELMQQNQALAIQIKGHTDNTGNANYNFLLSESRAKSVYEYLLQNGISASRISYKGFGETLPIADNDTESGRAQNRRTEFTVVAF